MSEKTTLEVGTDRIYTWTECLDRLYTIAVQTCGRDEDLAIEAFAKFFTGKSQERYDEQQPHYAAMAKKILLACQRILHEESMIDDESSILEDEFWEDSDVQAYLEERMQTAEIELRAGKTVSLRTVIEEKKRNE